MPWRPQTSGRAQERPWQSMQALRSPCLPAWRNSQRRSASSCWMPSAQTSRSPGRGLLRAPATAALPTEVRRGRLRISGRTQPCSTMSAEECQVHAQSKLGSTHSTLAVAHQQCGVRKKSWLSATIMSSYRNHSVAITVAQAVRVPSLQAGPSGCGAGEGEGQRLGRVAEETLAGATHLTAFERHAAARLIHLLSAYAVHDPETGYCQVCFIPDSIFAGLVDPGTKQGV